MAVSESTGGTNERREGGREQEALLFKRRWCKVRLAATTENTLSRN